MPKLRHVRIRLSGLPAPIKGRHHIQWYSRHGGWIVYGVINMKWRIVGGPCVKYEQAQEIVKKREEEGIC